MPTTQHTTQTGKDTAPAASRSRRRGTRLAGAGLIALLGMAISIPGKPAIAAPAAEKNDTFMSVAPLQVAVIRKGRPRGVLMVDIGLEVPDKDLRARVRSGLPRLRDHMLRSLSLYAAHAIDFHHTVNVARLAGRLQTIADAYADGDTIRVLLVNVTLQK